MLKRWLIRSVFMLPLLLSVVGWGVSGWYHCHLDYSKFPYSYCVGTSWGTVSICRYTYGSDYPYPIGWDYQAMPNPSVRFWPEITFASAPPHFLGFSLFHGSVGFAYADVLDAPYWFLILLFGIALLFVWRKTRKPIELRAFPVELADKKRT
jgi:hypothetical protein